MNMAFKCIRLSLGVILFCLVNAETEDFPSLDCKVENLGQYSQQSLLQCVIKNANSDTVIQIVSWKKASRNILVFTEGEIKNQEQGFSFAQPSWNNRSMNVSLLISNTAVEHQGEYSCYVLTDYGSGFEKTSLKVTAKYSKPKISSSQNTLTCESDGGYPEGQLRWFDEHNVELTSDAQTETKPVDGGLFQLSSKLIVENKSPVSCRVFNAGGGQEEETPFEEIDEPKTEAILREILTQLEIIKEQQKVIIIQLQSKTSAAEPIDVSGFPLSTLEDLRQVETNLSVDTDFKEKLVTYFGLVGGLTVKETVWRVLGKMMSNSLAKTINWRVVNGKTSFESLGLKDVVLKSVRRNSVNANASDGETEHFIKRWLQLASDREGGRRERALRQAAPEPQP